MRAPEPYGFPSVRVAVPWAGQYHWASEVYTVGGVPYDAMTGRSLAVDYGEMRHQRYLATRSTWQAVKDGCALFR